MANTGALDTIAGIERYGNALIVNAIEFCDAPGDTIDTMLVLINANDLAKSPVKAFL